MKDNLSKCHLLLSSKSFKSCPEVVSIDGIQITSNTVEFPLGITIYLPYVTKWAETLMLLRRLPIICP